MTQTRTFSRQTTAKGYLYRTFMRPIVRRDVTNGPFAELIQAMHWKEREKYIQKTLQELWNNLPLEPQPNMPRNQCKAYWAQLSRDLRGGQQVIQRAARRFLARRRVQQQIAPGAIVNVPLTTVTVTVTVNQPQP